MFWYSFWIQREQWFNWKWINEIIWCHYYIILIIFGQKNITDEKFLSLYWELISESFRMCLLSKTSLEISESTGRESIGVWHQAASPVDVLMLYRIVCLPHPLTSSQSLSYVTGFWLWRYCGLWEYEWSPWLWHCCIVPGQRNPLFHWGIFVII